MCFSSFFFRTSAGRSTKRKPSIWRRFSSFFFRTSAGLRRRAPCRAFKVSVPSSSGLRLDASSTTTATDRSFQFLLLQDFGWTQVQVQVQVCTGFSSFFFRTSAGLWAGQYTLHYIVSVPSSSGLRLDRTYCSDRNPPRVSVPSSSGLRLDINVGDNTTLPPFQFLLLQDFGWTPVCCGGQRSVVFQFLLLQDFGWT